MFTYIYASMYHRWMDKWTDEGLESYFQTHCLQFQEIKKIKNKTYFLFYSLISEYYNFKIRNLRDKTVLNIQSLGFPTKLALILR